MKISVITVCYNAEKVIEKTILSVLNQSYQEIEYIIIDGDSKDCTMDIVRKYADDQRIKYISEPDHGIYDAMNKGIRLATGEYIEFLNAGDTFVDHNVVAKVVDEIGKNPADVMYGNIIYQYPDGSTNIRVYGQFCSGLFYYLLGDCINHQAVFAKKECFRENIFNISYRICADREWMIRVKLNKKTFRAMNALICCYSLDEESASIKNGDIYFAEAARCIKEHLKAGYWIYYIVDRIRHGKLSAKILHGLYEIVFLREH